MRALIRSMIDGEPVHRFLREPRPGFIPNVREPGPTRLTRRETDILRELRTGKSNKEMAHVFGLTEGTIKNYVKTICDRLGEPNRTALALWAERRAVAEERMR